MLSLPLNPQQTELLLATPLSLYPPHPADRAEPVLKDPNNWIRAKTSMALMNLSSTIRTTGPRKVAMMAAEAGSMKPRQSCYNCRPAILSCRGRKTRAKMAASAARFLLVLPAISRSKSPQAQRTERRRSMRTAISPMCPTRISMAPTVSPIRLRMTKATRALGQSLLR